MKLQLILLSTNYMKEQSRSVIFPTKGNDVKDKFLLRRLSRYLRNFDKN